MVLLIDIGNTTVAVYEADTATGNISLLHRFPTDIADNYIELFKKGKSDTEPSGCAICSVVPTVTKAVDTAIKSVYNIEPHIFSYTDIPMKIEVDEPEKVGMDRLMDAYFAYTNAPLPAVTVDLGTATTIGVITRKGFIGGSISAGIETALKSIAKKGAQLFDVELSAPNCSIGKNTKECLIIGAVCTTAAMIDGMTRLIEKELGCEVSLLITGGYSCLVDDYVFHKKIIETNMIPKSMLMLYCELFG